MQSTYSWSSGQLAEFLLHKYYIINKKIPLKDVYIGFWMHSSIGNIGAADNYHRRVHPLVPRITRWRSLRILPGVGRRGHQPDRFQCDDANDAPTLQFQLLRA